ncbi:MAG: heavy-metal-associated domain-containing protein [Arcobacter butzleri]|jgi:copper chaperone CopZ|nr:heavy-metal-associated domain-containing protein [Arcobacteraceae bacterium]MDY0364973.1 heavy-metal-associated domain-containing protein [Arcobacteraceae bacterium]NLO16916.1 heavy-metal-associated domain-containing protein [Aliarcobacter butzleri]
MTKQSFEVNNVKCGGCANTLKKGLKSEFGEVEVDLEKFPRVITLLIDDTKIDTLKSKLRSMGYPLVTDELSTIENIQTKAKSFVSCAIGKFDK